MKKLWKLGLCLTLAMSIFTLQDQGVHAADDAIKLTELDITFSENNGILQLDLQKGVDDTEISSIVIEFVKEGDASREENVYFNKIIDEDTVFYKSYLNLNELQKGTYVAKSVTLMYMDSNEIKLDSSCTASTSGNAECAGHSTVLDDKWEKLTIEGKADYVYPVINSIKGKGFEKNVDLKSHQFSIETDLSVKDASSQISLVYNSDKTTELGAVSLVTENGSFYVDDKICYKGENFTLAYIEIHVWDKENYIPSIYSSLSREELRKYSNIPSSYAHHNINEIAKEGDFDFSVQNYINDTTPPELVSADWETSEVSLPGLAKFNIEIRDTESGFNNFRIMFNKEDFVVSGGALYDGKGSWEYMFSRYRSLDPVQVYGFIIDDNAGNQVYYLTDMDAYDKEMNQYHGMEIEPSSTVREWKKPIKELTFKRTQDYTEILKNDKTAIDTLNKATKGSLYVINTYGNSMIDKSVFEAVKGKDVTLIFEDVDSNDAVSTGIQWIINGLDIKNPKTIDTKLETELNNGKVTGTNYGFGGISQDSSLAEINAFVIDMLKQEPLAYYAEYIKQFDIEKENYMTLFWEEYNRNQKIDFVFADNGELPGKTTIRFKTEYALRNKMPANGLYAYYVKDNQYDLIAENVARDKEGYYSFDITHNSDYVLTPKKMHTEETTDPGEKDPIAPVVPEKTEPEKEKKEDKKGVDTGDHSSTLTAGWIGTSVIALAVIALVIYKRNIRKEL